MNTNNYKNRKIAWVHRGESPHPAHAGFAEAIGADLIGLNRLTIPKIEESIIEEVLNGVFLPKYDIYVVEGTRAMYGMLSSQVIRDGTLIYLAGDQAVYKLTEDSYELHSPLNRLISRYGLGIMRQLFTHFVDGVMAVSEFSADYTRRVIEDKPTRVANPYIASQELYETLGDVDPALETNVAVTVGTYSRYKGHDLLIDAWPQVREVHPDAELELVGNGYQSEFESVSGVTVRGFVDELPPVFASASLYVQPSRADNFPVSVLEAMRAGLPAIVTSSTGSKSEIRNLNEEFVCRPTSQDIANAVNSYFDLSPDCRRVLSESAREIGTGYDSDTRKRAFREQFVNLLSEIDDERS